jgi:hypothetical protein
MEFVLRKKDTTNGRFIVLIELTAFCLSITMQQVKRLVNVSLGFIIGFMHLSICITKFPICNSFSDSIGLSCFLYREFESVLPCKARKTPNVFTSPGIGTGKRNKSYGSYNEQ